LDDINDVLMVIRSANESGSTIGDNDERGWDPGDALAAAMVCCGLL
jgi:hypothetical protein